MADIDLKTDEEKAEELKRWWKENGTSVFVGIALAIGGMFGWQQWQAHTKNQAEGASRLYAQLDNKDSDSADILKQLHDDYDGTPYSALAALKTAKKVCVTGKPEDCESLLRQASKSSQEDISIIANLHLARTLISTNKLDEAQSIANQKIPTAYTSLVDEIKGDIYFAKKEFEKAREAYDRAILSSAGQNVQFLKMKRDDLGNASKNSDSKPTSKKDASSSLENSAKNG